MRETNEEISKDFKMTEIGPLPDDWKVMKLEEAAEIIMGQSPPGGSYNKLGQGIPFLQGKAKFGTISPKHVRYTTKPLKIGSEGSVLISVRAPVGDVNIANIDYCIGRGLASLSLNKGENFFLFFLLSFSKNRIKREGTGSTFKAISKSKLQNFEIPLPSLSEQKKIAFVLSTIQQAKEKTEAVIYATKELKKSLMKHLFTYGPVSVDEAENVVLKETEVGLIPEKWKVRSLRKLNTKKKATLNPLDFPNEIFEYYSIPAYQDSEKPVLEKGATILSQKIILEDGAVLFGKLNPRVEKVWRVRSYSDCRKIGSTEWIPIFPDHNEVDSNYLYYIEWSEYVMSLAKTLVTGSTPSRQRVDQKSFYKIKIPLPSLTTQQEIANILSRVDQKIQAEQTKKEALEQLFKTMLHNLMTGKIRVTHLEVPHDHTW